jgi:NitT/TauT family transport system substrate-binding protein
MLFLSALTSAREQPAPLRVYGALSVVELGPVLMAAQRLGPDAVTVSNGGVPNLFKPGEADVATNAETQALRVSVEHPDLRIILTVAEGYYRVVARKSAGIAKLGDLRGKKIGTVPNTSAAYYLHRMLATAGLSESDVTVVSLVPVSKMPTALKSGEVDAITIWEPEIQNAQDALGADAIEFQDKAVYRELFNLNTTAANLADPARRKQIVAFVAEIIRASADLRAGSREAFPLLAKSTGYEPALLEKIWHHEGFYGDLVRDLPDVMTDEDVWLAKAAQRGPRTRAELVTLVDPSVRLEALELLKQK